MTRATVAQLFHSIRTWNGLLDSAISQIQSAWPKVLALPAPPPAKHAGPPRRKASNPQAAHESAAPRAAPTEFSRAAAWLTARAATDARLVAFDASGDDSLAEFAAAYGDRYFEIPLEDPHALAWCLDMARGGCQPFLFVRGSPTSERLDNVLAEICRSGSSFKVLLPPPTHFPKHRSSGHGAPAWNLRGCPQATVMSPIDERELEAMLEFSLQHMQPSLIMLPESLSANDAQVPIAPVVLGRAQALAQGTHLALIARGSVAAAAREAAGILGAEGIDCAVLNLRFVQPLDAEAILQTAGKVRATIVLEDSSTGCAGEILELLTSHDVLRPMTVWKPPHCDDPCDSSHRHDRYLESIVDCCRQLAQNWPLKPRNRRNERRGAVAAPIPAEVRPPDRAGCRQVLEQQLSATILPWVQAYSEVGPRDLYLWKWGAAGATLTRLPCALPEFDAHSCDTKVLSIMFNALLDDVADCRQQSGLLPVLMSVMHDQRPDTSGLAEAERKYVEFTARVWDEYWSRLRTYPCFSAFEELLRYDLTQLFNSIQYSSLLNRHLGLLNCVEHDLYSPHNMMMMTFATVDLMCSPHFELTELGKLREAMWHAQWMGRIGNLVTTWQREIGVGDFTSGVFARAVSSGDLTIDELQRGDRGQIESAIERGRHQDYYRGRWHHHRRCYLRRANEVRSVDLHGLLEGHDQLLQTYLQSRGFL